MSEEESITSGTATSDPAIEKLKLFKMTKGYNWEIQLCAVKPLKAEDLLERLAKINDKLSENYGVANAL